MAFEGAPCVEEYKKNMRIRRLKAIAAFFFGPAEEPTDAPYKRERKEIERLKSHISF